MVDINLGAVSSNVPKDLYVSLRIGEVQKFAKASASRGYRFPAAAVGDKRYGRLEIYQRIGSSSILIDPELVQGQHELTIPLDRNDVPSLTFRYDTSGAEGGAQPKVDTMTAQQEEAQAYLVKHQVELQMFEAMKALLSERPADPAAFIAQRLLSGAGRTTKVNDEPIDAATKSQQPLTEEDLRGMQKIQSIQAKMASELEKAAQEGRLAVALKGAAPSLEDAAAAKRTEVDADRLRAQARQTLAAATGDGSLAKALDNLQKRPRSEQSAKVTAVDEGVEATTVEALRETTKSSLTKAMEDGTLESSLAKLQNERAQAELTAGGEAVMDDVRQVLLEASENRLLDSILEEMSPRGQGRAKAAAKLEQPDEAAGEAVMDDARMALLEASENGLLDALLEEMSPRGQAKVSAELQPPDAAAGTEDPQALRERFRDVLVSASQDGRLESALAGVGPAPDADNISSLRTSCRDVLVKASKDGSLEEALENIAGQQLTSEEAKILKEQSAELQRTVEELKVAVQQLQQERRG
mmetsp:Transcript_2661/g.6880  ORF Transcript_2661/g.6880 Transcript_2661/m.6880 type:complete len:527 (-) Transcript_2661:64-1644(-)